jgi:hypothetical protein
VSEVKVLEIAKRLGEDDPDIKGHIPEVVSSVDLGYPTDVIRGALGLANRGNDGSQRSSLRTRILRVIVFRLQRPITDLEGADFTKAWIECVRCKFTK